MASATNFIATWLFLWMPMLPDVHLLGHLVDVSDKMRCESLSLLPAPIGAEVAIDVCLWIGMPTPTPAVAFGWGTIAVTPPTDTTGEWQRDGLWYALPATCRGGKGEASGGTHLDAAVEQRHSSPWGHCFRCTCGHQMYRPCPNGCNRGGMRRWSQVISQSLISRSEGLYFL